MTANELADALEQAKSISEVARLVKEETIPMLRRLSAENDALKMGFANSGTSDSELAETRAMANRLTLKINNLQIENDALKKTVDSLFDGLNSSLLLNKAQAERNEK